MSPLDPRPLPGGSFTFVTVRRHVVSSARAVIIERPSSPSYCGTYDARTRRTVPTRTDNETGTCTTHGTAGVAPKQDPVGRETLIRRDNRIGGRYSPFIKSPLVDIISSSTTIAVNDSVRRDNGHHTYAVLIRSKR